MRRQGAACTSLPKLNLDHLFRLTDCTGIIQHSVFSIPDYQSGYTTDDNARALRAALQLYDLTSDTRMLELAVKYMGFLAYTQDERGKWRNFVGYTREFLEEEGSEDSFGRAIHACTYAARTRAHEGIAQLSRRLLERALPWASSLRAPRAIAFCVAGLAELHYEYPDSKIYNLMCTLADSLVELYRRASDSKKKWHWFEDRLTYCNAAFSKALFLAYVASEKHIYLKVARESLDFLINATLKNGKLKVIGNRGWWLKGARPAEFDEQPVDAGLMVEALLAGYSATEDSSYYSQAEDAFAWFLGKNSMGIPLYDPRTGGCFDGITPDGVNLNQGAESLLAYMLAYLKLRETEVKRNEAAG
ncbi:MAG TPA: glycosyltransferase [Firmicutes bacterium]|nr:glycosyltransferase [Bacillota bacterium]